MADNDQSKVRYDDFISAVQPDPAKPEAAIMLAGFVGHGPDGQVRIYPDPSLGKWYDVAEADVLHSMPVADSKLGGSYVWVRDSAQIKSGSATTAAPAAAPQALAAANAPPQTGVQDCTLAFCDQNLRQNWNQPTPQTHCFICPPISQQLCQIQTQPLHCQTQPVVCDIPPQSLHCATHPVVCDIPPRQTLATICTQVGCVTQPVVCGILPPSFNCTQQGCGAGVQPGGQQAQLHAMAVQPTPSAVHQCGGVHPTLATLCTQPHLCPPQAPGTAMFSWPAQCPSQFCSAVGACGQAPQAGPPGTAMFYCTMNCGAPMQPQAAAPGANVATVYFCTFAQGCPITPQPQAMAAAPGPAMPMPSQFLCTPFQGTCAAPQAAAMDTPSGFYCTTPWATGAAPQAAAAQQPLTQGICPTPSAIHQCGQPLTQGICPTPSAIHQCGQPLTQGICPTPSAIHQCGQPTIATLCTQPHLCPPPGGGATVPYTACICPTPTATAALVCLQTANLGCVPSIACGATPNGVFTPFGR